MNAGEGVKLNCQDPREALVAQALSQVVAELAQGSHRFLLENQGKAALRGAAQRGVDCPGAFEAVPGSCEVDFGYVVERDRVRHPKRY